MSRYDEYTVQVREEYAAVPDDVFASARAAILRPFIDRESIYATDLRPGQLGGRRPAQPGGRAGDPDGGPSSMSGHQKRSPERLRNSSTLTHCGSTASSSVAVSSGAAERMRAR